jgi:hypothetical protein
MLNIALYIAVNIGIFIGNTEVSKIIYKARSMTLDIKTQKSWKYKNRTGKIWQSSPGKNKLDVRSSNETSMGCAWMLAWQGTACSFFLNSRSDIVILDFVRILYIYMHNDAPAVVSFQILLMNDFPSFAIELL